MIRPMGYQILVKPDVVEEKTKGGIILPDKVKDRDQFGQESGVFIDAGSIAFTDPVWKEYPGKGAKVIFKKYAGIVVEYDGEDYRLMPDNEIGAVVE